MESSKRNECKYGCSAITLGTSDRATVRDSLARMSIKDFALC